MKKTVSHVKGARYHVRILLFILKNNRHVIEIVKMEVYMKKTIGIIGGMGPMATVDLYRKIVDYTAASKDSEHIHVYIDSNTDIPDRTEAILHGGKDPVPEMVGSAIRLECMGADFLLIPCNTAHYFYDKICPMVHIPILNMLEETALEVKRQSIACVGLLATDGTIESGVYDQVLRSMV